MTAASDDPATLAAQLVALLALEELDTDLYRGSRQPGGIGRVFGGQVIAQALQAAQASTPGKVAHSLHAYFMRPGSEDHAIVFRVERDFDGRSFATRRVEAVQAGEPILTLTASFQSAEEGLHHQVAMPEVAPPEALTSEHEIRARFADAVPEQVRHFFLRTRPIELRPVEPRDWLHPAPSAPFQHVWFRAVAPLPDDPVLHRAALAYASDMVLLGTSLLPHGMHWLTQKMQVASLDHALWLHEPFRCDDWLLYAADSPWSGHARGFNRGQIFARDGRLVASVAQESLIRRRG
jgi:acyl-CoA thioesterase-2